VPWTLGWVWTGSGGPAWDEQAWAALSLGVWLSAAPSSWLAWRELDGVCEVILADALVLGKERRISVLTA
jgi:hypothetical protein